MKIQKTLTLTDKCLTQLEELGEFHAITGLGARIEFIVNQAHRDAFGEATPSNEEQESQFDFEMDYLKKWKELNEQGEGFTKEYAPDMRGYEIKISSRTDNDVDVFYNPSSGGVVAVSSDGWCQQVVPENS